MSRQNTSLICIALCLVWLLPPATLAQQAAAPRPAAQIKAPLMTIKVATEIVLVNVTVKDKQGNPVKGLKPADFTILEDGKPQHIQSFDFENVDAQPAPVEAADTAPTGTVIAGTGPKPAPKPAAPAANPDDQFRDQRLWVMYFDLTTMQPEDVQNVVEQAETYVQKKMQPADMIAIASLGNSLQINQDFTKDKDALMKVLKGLNPATSAGFADGDDGTTDNGNTFTADSSEFDIANADRSLQALQSLGDLLGKIQQKKSLLYYSSGIQRSGVDNEITLRSAVNSLNKGNVSVYTMDARGLQANPPGGNATSASSRGSGAFNGSSQTNQLNSNFAQQETISTLATETGGKSFLEANDFSVVYQQVQKDTQSYYLIGYSSANKAKDGKYRKIVVKIPDHPDVSINAKNGYYAGKDINHLNTADRQSQLQDELEANVTDHSLDLYVTDGFLRLDAKRYFVPVAVTIPGSEIPLHGVNPKATPEVDIAGEVIDQSGRKLDHVGQTIQLTPAVAGGATSQLQNKNLQYNTGFILAPGQKYQIRFAARENQSGQMGAFETVVVVPDVDANETKDPTLLPMSSVLLGSQLAPARLDPDNPLTDSGNALVLNVNHVFANNQHLYLYYEIYDPKITSGDSIKVMTNVAFYHGKVKAFQTPIVTTEQVTDVRRKAAVVQLDIPLSELKPGTYTCQVNAIDDAAGRFAFPRVPIVIRPVAGGAAATSK